MGWESFDVITFDLEPLLQGKMRTSKLKSAYNLLIIRPRGFNVKPTYRKTWTGNLLVWSDLTSRSNEDSQLISAYNSFIIDPRGLQCETKL